MTSHRWWTRAELAATATRCGRRRCSSCGTGWTSEAPRSISGCRRSRPCPWRTCRRLTVTDSLSTSCSPREERDAATQPLGPAQRAARPGPRQPRDQPARLGLRLPLGQPPGAVVRAVPHLRGALDRAAARRDRRVHRPRAEAVRRHRAPARGGPAARARQPAAAGPPYAGSTRCTRMYDISNEDFRYVLATFVVVPKRWMDDHGFRTMTPNEIAATTNYYIELGRHMNIKDIPQDYAGFERLLDDYEREHFAFDAGGRRVADSTLDLMTTFPPNSWAPKWAVQPVRVLADGRAAAPRLPLPGPEPRRAVVLPRRDAAARPAAAALPGAVEAEVGEHVRLLPHLPRRLRDRRPRHLPPRRPRAHCDSTTEQGEAAS